MVVVGREVVVGKDDFGSGGTILALTIGREEGDDESVSGSWFPAKINGTTGGGGGGTSAGVVCT